MSSFVACLLVACVAASLGGALKGRINVPAAGDATLWLHGSAASRAAAPLSDGQFELCVRAWS